MTRAGAEREGPRRGVTRALAMPLWAAFTAALGSYFGVVRTIDKLQTEVRVARAEYRATSAALVRRLDKLEAALPRDIATQRDIAAVREADERTVETWVRRHEEAYHHQTGRRTE